MVKKRRALILYATMTRNTEKVAEWFKETFLYYNWEVEVIRLTPKMDWNAYAGKTWFDDYDVICLGSPIVAGAPLKPVADHMGLNGDGVTFEAAVEKRLNGEEAASSGVTAAPGGRWRKTSAPYPGIYNKANARPYGIVFCTYGGGFYGAAECSATLAMLELYLRNYDVDTIGKFACGGKETGPAGGAVGTKPKAYFKPRTDRSLIPDADVQDAVTYTTADGKQWPGSYFFHYNNDEKPGPKEESRARIFISDIVEDYFMTYDDERFIGVSQVISIS